MENEVGKLFDPEDEVFFELTPGSLQEMLISRKYQLAVDMADDAGRITDSEDEFWFSNKVSE
jgi:hypothetical protein